MIFIGPRLWGQLGLEPSPPTVRAIDVHGETVAAPLESVDVALGGIQIERHPVLVLAPSPSAREGITPVEDSMDSSGGTRSAS